MRDRDLTLATFSMLRPASLSWKRNMCVLRILVVLKWRLPNSFRTGPTGLVSGTVWDTARSRWNDGVPDGGRGCRILMALQCMQDPGTSS